MILGIVKGHSASGSGFRAMAQFTVDLRDLKLDRMVPFSRSDARRVAETR